MTLVEGIGVGGLEGAVETFVLETWGKQLKHLNDFISEKLHVSMNRGPQLRVSAIMYGHIEGAPMYAKRLAQI